MKTKKMLFKAAVCLMAVMFVFSSVSALAADYITYTTYDLETENVTVKTVVSDVAAGEVAYLVHTGAEATDETIVHIDQISEAPYNFEFTTTKTELTDTHSVLVGTQDGKVIPSVALATGAVTYKLTVNVTNGSASISDKVNVADVVNVDETAEIWVGNENDLLLGLTADDGFDTPVITLNDAEFTGAELGKLNADSVLNITFEKAVITPEIVEDDDQTVESVVVPEEIKNEAGEVVGTKVSYSKFAKISAPAGLTKYGIIVLNNVNGLADAALEAEMVVNGANVTTLEGALPETVATSGLFAFVIEGLSTEFTNDLCIRTYAIFGEGTEPVYGAVQTYAAN